MITAVDFAAYLACDACKAPAGTPCRTRTGGGPQALPDTYADRAHAGRALNAATRPATLPTRPRVRRAPRAPRAAVTPAPVAAARPAPAWLKPRRRPPAS